jgi:hypothetical protein
MGEAAEGMEVDQLSLMTDRQDATREGATLPETFEEAVDLLQTGWGVEDGRGRAAAGGEEDKEDQDGGERSRRCSHAVP